MLSLILQSSWFQDDSYTVVTVSLRNVIVNRIVVASVVSFGRVDSRPFLSIKYLILIRHGILHLWLSYILRLVFLIMRRYI